VAGTPDNKSSFFTVPKRKGLSIIAEEANRKASLPGPNKYTTKPIDNWGKGNSYNATPIVSSKEKRITEIDRIAIRNQKKETSTPSPLVYSPDRKLVLDKLGAGLGIVSMKQ